MTAYESTERSLQAEPGLWLVTGAAGFIGSNLVEALLRLNQRVIGLDNFSTGHRRNLNEALAAVTPAQAARYTLVEGDIRDAAICRQAVAGAQYVLHQAAIGSVPRSIEDPATCHDVNTTGFVRMIEAAREAGVRRFVYASSSAVYGDEPGLPKVEQRIGQPLSPYAATKLMNEIYARVFAGCYGMQTIGLRYFNVFGPRQDPAGSYAAVIPKWIEALQQRQPVQIYGDGETSRDFCYVKNVVQANLLAATVSREEAVNQIYNVACGVRTSLNQLYELLRTRVGAQAEKARATYAGFRAGDVRHSQADISQARRLLGYEPNYGLEAGLDEAFPWYVARQTLATAEAR